METTRANFDGDALVAGRSVMDDEIRIASQALEDGKIVCLPTESSYGLAVDIRSEPALSRLATLKGRHPGAPFPVVAADVEQAQALTRDWPLAAQRLAAKHWPGPLTLILPAVPKTPVCLLGERGGIGVRISGHSIPRALCESLGFAITATSCNPTGQPAAATVAEARAYFGTAVDIYLDGGDCRGPFSTVAEVSPDGELHIVRSGAIDLSGAL